MENKTVTPLGEKGRIVIGFLQANEGGHFGDEIAAATDLNARGIHGVMNGLFKRGLVSKDKAPRTVVDKEGNEVEKEYTVYSLTDAGVAFDLD